MEKRFNYVYLTINKLTGKCYIGSHAENVLSEKYIGSGTALKFAIKKYGKSNFLKIKLKYFSTIVEARKAEAQYIQLFDTLSVAASRKQNVNTAGLK